jgi:hypothetical protein
MLKEALMPLGWPVARGMLGALVLAAGFDEPAALPPLTPPAENASTPAPAPAAPAPAAAPSVADELRPLLVVPGLPTPRRAGVSALPSLPAIEPLLPEPEAPVAAEGVEGPPPLVAPLDEDPDRPRPAVPRAEPPGGAGGPPPMSLDLELEPERPGRSGESGGSSTSPVLTSRPRTREEELEAKLRAAREQLKEMPSRKRRLFGVIPLPGNARREAEDRERLERLQELVEEAEREASDADRDRPEDDPDPAVDTLLRRRIEAQIQSSLAGRVRDVSVRVSGKKVWVQARAVYFWQKRGVRRALETLPALAGLQSKVELLD